MLRDVDWQISYSPADGDPLKLFYEPALIHAVRYDRSSGYFSAESLTLVTRGIEALIRNRGKMRLLVGCTLKEEEIRAISRGEATLKERIDANLSDQLDDPAAAPMRDALELLAWMVANEYLAIKVVVPFDSEGEPVHVNHALYHPKKGVVEDADQDRIAWKGSLNESVAGWQRNWEEFSVFTDWQTREYVDEIETSFTNMWDGSNLGHGYIWRSYSIPEASKRKLLAYLPEGKQRPKRHPLKKETNESAKKRQAYWEWVDTAPLSDNGGERVGEATANVKPWPHQHYAFSRLYNDWPPRLLIADEVGLGKTIQAGMLIRQTWLAKQAKRILLLVPKALEKQWQTELREKFNLDFPIYSSGEFTWGSPTAAVRMKSQSAETEAWSHQGTFIMSSQLARREERARALVAAPFWDLVILDEAHHARRRPSRNEDEDRPNRLLMLMRELKERTQSLLLLTATPMQVSPLEVWELLQLLGLPEAWTRRRFQEFYSRPSEITPVIEKLRQHQDLYRATETSFGHVPKKLVEQTGGLSSFQSAKVLNALRNEQSTIPLQQLNSDEKKIALKILKSWTPLKHRISRHTRETLRTYVKKGILNQRVAVREVLDSFIEMSVAERQAYSDVEAYISTTFNRASTTARSAIGFVMTVYRRRVASSFNALSQTLARRAEALGDSVTNLLVSEDDVRDDEMAEESQTFEEAQEFQTEALALEERFEIERLQKGIDRLPEDSKLETLINVLVKLRSDGYSQVMVFTQYTDTMDYIRTKLLALGERNLMCYSGRGSEVPSYGEQWASLSRDEAKEKFRSGEVDTFLCTDAAAEGLNFQFCGALVNYDMPWNPMRVEQRIGRIDRVGQKFNNIRIINLHYNDTVETDVYQALRERIDLFVNVVGPLQPILATLPSDIQEAVLTGDRERIDDLPERIDVLEENAFDLDAELLSENTETPQLNSPALDFNYLKRSLLEPELLPVGVAATRTSSLEFHVTIESLGTFRVSTDPSFYDAHSDNVELWSPGGAIFDTVKELAREEFLTQRAN